MSADDPQQGSRYTHQEVRLIFERAGRSEALRDGDQRYSLREIQAIGAEAGIDADDIRRAAASIRELPASHRLLGAPTRFYASHFLDQPLGEERLGDVVEAVRRATGMHGELKWVPLGVEWRARPALGAIILQFTPKQGGARIDLVVAREDAAALWGFVGCGVGAVAGVISAAVVGFGLGAGPLPTLATLVVSTAVAAYGSARLLWRLAARRAASITESLLDTVAAAAEPETGAVPEA